MSGRLVSGPSIRLPSKTKILVAIVGPTATGKSTLGIEIAERFGGEVISCDSTAVYRGFDIGTDKVSLEGRRGIPHHLIDVVDPRDGLPRHVVDGAVCCDRIRWPGDNTHRHTEAAGCLWGKAIVAQRYRGGESLADTKIPVAVVFL